MLCLPYDGFDGEAYAFFNLKGAKLLQTKQVMQLAADWQFFSQGLLGALSDMAVYLAKQEGDRHETA